jgi:hypothetical protein
MGLANGKNATAGQAGKTAANTPANAAPAVRPANPAPLGQPQAWRMQPPPWMAQGAPANRAAMPPAPKVMPAPQAMPAPQGMNAPAHPNWGPATPPWMAKNAGQANGQAMGTGTAAAMGQQSNATRTAPWWGGVVTNGGNRK